MITDEQIIGVKFNRLMPVAFYQTKGGNRYYTCLCDCGNMSFVRGWSLVNNHTQSCGCFQKDQTIAKTKRDTMGMSKSDEYRCWADMIQRCTNKEHPDYKYYGGRGVTVCCQWLNSFRQFYCDMGKRPANLTLDRINNNGNYESLNCRWATRQEQLDNRSR